MIYDAAKAIHATLAAKRFPVAVYYGPEMLQPSGAFDSRIVIERDRKQGDNVTDPMGAQRNPRRVAMRLVGARAVVYAKSSEAGARVCEHEALCDQLVDALICALRAWAQAHGHLAALNISEARTLDAGEIPGLANAQVWSGVAYSLRWRVPRGVYDVTFKGEGLPTVHPAASTNRVEVRKDGAAPPEVVEP